MDVIRYSIPSWRDDPGYCGVGLVVTEDYWELDGKRLGPDTCTVLDWIAFCSCEVAWASYYVAEAIERILDIGGRGKRPPRYTDLKGLVSWLRCNFDYPAPGEA